MASDVIDLLRALVRIPTGSGTAAEVEGLRAVATWFDGAPGADVVLHDDGSDASCLTVLPSGDPNRTRNQPDARPLLLFSAHIDVVPVTDEAGWTHDPFGAVVVDGRVHGRGTSDMKSGLAAAAVAVRTLLEAGHPVGLAISRGEEIGCRGAEAVARALAGRRIGALVIPESTLGQVVLGHRGALWLTVSTAGRAAHGSTPQNGDNAVLAMARVLSDLSSIPLGEHQDLGAETVNIGTITGGSVPNIVPDACSIEVDLRLAKSDPAGLVTWWRSRPEVVEVRIDLELDAVWTRRDHPFVALLGAPVSSAPASYYTDASVLCRTLDADLPVVIWGPGDPGVVHSVDESVAVDDVERAVKQFTAAGRAWSADVVESGPALSETNTTSA